MTPPHTTAPSDSWRVAPILGVASPRRSAEYWRDVFGFTLDPLDGVFTPVPGDPDGVYAIVKHGDAWVHFQKRPARETPAPRGPLERDVYCYVADVVALHAAITARGATIVQPPVAMPYGLVECVAEDPDGHRVAFGQILP